MRTSFFFFCGDHCVSRRERSLTLLGQWTLKKRLAGATSEPIPSCPSCVCDWEHLDVLYFQEPVLQCVGTCTFLAVTCATSLSLSFWRVLSTTEASCFQRGERHFLKLSVCLTLFLSFTTEFFGKKSIRSEVMVLEHSCFLYFFNFGKQWWSDRSPQRQAISNSPNNSRLVRGLQPAAVSTPPPPPGPPRQKLKARQGKN